jgi:hypothetical protein
MELAQLPQEAEASKNLIAEARRDAEEAIAAVVDATARAATKAQQDVEAARQEETRHARMQKEAA